MINEASCSFARALEIDRGFGPAYLASAELRFATKPRDTAQVEEILRSCPEGGAPSAFHHLCRAEVAYLRGEYAEAAQAYDAALGIASLREASLGAASCLFGKGKEREAVASMRGALKNTWSTPFDRFAPPETLEIPAPFLDAALRRGRQMMALLPDAWEPQILTALVLEVKKQYGEALALYERARQRWGGSAALCLRAGRLSLRLGQIGDAAHRFSEYLEREPGDGEVRHLLAKCLVRIGRIQDAVDQLESALRGGTRGPEVRFLLAALYEKSGRYAEAEEQYMAVLDDEPGHRRAGAALQMVRRLLGWREYFARGLALFAGGGADEAIAMWQIGLSIEEALPLRVYLGVACFSKGLVINAFYEAERALVLLDVKEAADDIRALAEKIGSEIQRRIFHDAGRTEQVGPKDVLGGVADDVGRILYSLSHFIDEKEIVATDLEESRLARSLGIADTDFTADLEESLAGREPEEHAPDVELLEPAQPEVCREEAPSEEARLRAFGEWLERELHRKSAESMVVILDSAVPERVSEIALRKERSRIAPPRSLIAAEGDAGIEALSWARQPARTYDWNQGLFWAFAGGWYPGLLLLVLLHVPGYGAFSLGFLLMLAAGVALSRFVSLEEWFDWKAGFLCGVVIGPTYIWLVIDFSMWDPLIGLGSSIFFMFLLGGVARVLISPPAMPSSGNPAGLRL
jgi:tetratricopeptide (TPR) repeat protein